MSDPREGWYPDPLGEADLRRWDGERWTVDTRDQPGVSVDGASAETGAAPGGGAAPRVAAAGASSARGVGHATGKRSVLPIVLGAFALLAGVAAVLWYLGFLGDGSAVDDGSLAGEEAALPGETVGEASQDPEPSLGGDEAPAELVLPEGYVAWTSEDPAVAFALPESWTDATSRFVDFVDPAAFAADGDTATLVGVYASQPDRESPDDTFVIHVASGVALDDQHATVLAGLGLPADDSPATATTAVGYPALRTIVEAGVEGFDHTVDVYTVESSGEYVTFACNSYAEAAQCAALTAIVDSAVIGN